MYDLSFCKSSLDGIQVILTNGPNRSFKEIEWEIKDSDRRTYKVLTKPGHSIEIIDNAVIDDLGNELKFTDLKVAEVLAIRIRLINKDGSSTNFTKYFYVA